MKNKEQSWEDLKNKVEELMDEVNASVIVPEEAIIDVMELFRSTIQAEKEALLQKLEKMMDEWPYNSIYVKSMKQILREVK